VGPLSCTDVSELTAEMALDLLDGEERGSVLAHLEGCPDCGHEVARCAEVVEALVVLAPSADPPQGFEDRVIERVENSRTQSPGVSSLDRRAPRWRTAVGAFGIAALVVLLTVLFAPTIEGGRVDIANESRALAATTMRSPAGDVVGSGYLYRGEQAWLVITVPDWQHNAAGYDAPRSHSVRIERRDGTVDVKPAHLADDGSWVSTLPERASDITSVAVVGPDGAMWCSGQFAAD
jgi:hypothetical protein